MVFLKNNYLFLFLTILFSLNSCSQEKNELTNKSFVSSDTNSKEYRESLPLSKLKFDIQVNPDSIKITEYAIIKTVFGDIKVALYGKDAPKTVKNFVTLACSGYFNGTLVHRIAKNFLIQMGDGNTRYLSKKDEWGKGGKSIYGGFFADEINLNSLIYKIGYTYGTVAMANSGPNKNLSQFFICLDEAQFLDKKYTIFGKVVDGMDVVEKIAEQDILPYKFDSLDGIPKEPIKIIRVEIERKKSFKF